jgi:hypothetical protein
VRLGAGSRSPSSPGFMEAQGGNVEIRTLVRAAAALDARLEIHLIAERSRSSGRPVRPYAAGAVAPAFVHKPAGGYGRKTATRKKSTRAASPRRGR